MKKKRLTPEEFCSNISDPDFLSGDGELVRTNDREGKVKHLSAECFIRYHLDEKETFTALDITLYDKKTMIGYISFFRIRDMESAGMPRYWINDSGNTNFLKNKIQTERENFIDFILMNHPDAGEWVLWNI